MAAAAAAGSATDSKSSKPFPHRAYIQKFDTVPPDYVLVATELAARGVPVTYLTTEDIIRKPWPVARTDLVVGNFDWTTRACKALGIAMPIPPDYPPCISALLQRKVWTSTLGDVQKWLKVPANSGISIFIKPAATAKAFAAIIEPKDGMIDTLIAGIPDVMDGLPASTPVHCSEVVDMISEFRVYVIYGKIRAVCQYRGATATAATTKDGSALDMAVVEDAVRTLTASADGKELTAFGIDFAVVRKPAPKTTAAAAVAAASYVTCLVEVNDGYSLGRYNGLSGSDYTDLLIARWGRLTGALAIGATGPHTKAN